MSKSSPIQNRFNGGVQTPRLRGNPESPRRDSSYTSSRNIIPTKYGPAERRNGSQWIAHDRDEDNTSFLYAFLYSDEEQYILEFTEDDDYGSILRFYRDNQMVFRTDADETADITSIAITGSQPRITIDAEMADISFVHNAIVYISGHKEDITGLNTGFYRIDTGTTAVTIGGGTTVFSITHMNGDAVELENTWSGSATGSVQRPVNLILPYQSGELFRADSSFIPKIVQSNDVIYITHPDYAPRIITRTSDVSWTIAKFDFRDGPYLGNPDGANLVSPANNPRLNVNTISVDKEINSFKYTSHYVMNTYGTYLFHNKKAWRMWPVDGHGIITDITLGSTTVVESDNHGLAAGDLVYINEIPGLGADPTNTYATISTWELNGGPYEVDSVDNSASPQTFTLDVDSTNFTAYDDGTATLAPGSWSRRNKNGALSYLIVTDKETFNREDTTAQTNAINIYSSGSTTILEIPPLNTETSVEQFWEGDRITINGLGTNMNRLDQRVFVLGEGTHSYNTRTITGATNNPTAVFTTSAAHGLGVGDIIYLTNLTGGTWSTLDDTFYQVNTVDSTTEFSVKYYGYGVRSDGDAVSGFGLGTLTDGDANTSLFTLKTTAGDDIDTSDTSLYPPFVPGTDNATITRGETDRVMRIRFEDSRALERWYWGNITKWINEYVAVWTLGEGQPPLPFEYLRTDRDEKYDNNRYPAGPGGGREIDGFIARRLYGQGASNANDLNSFNFTRKTSADQFELGCYSDTLGYPSVCAIHQGRLLLGSSDSFPRELNGSQSGDFNTTGADFSPTVSLLGSIVDSNGIQIGVGSGDGAPIQWLESLRGGIMVGNTTSEGIITAGESGSGGTISPSNAAYTRQETNGCSTIQPIVIGESIIYIQRAGRRVYDMLYGIQQDGYQSREISELAEHLFDSAIIDFAYARNPYDILWFALSNGKLIGCTYDKDNDIIAWHEHLLGGTDAKAEGVAVISAPDLESDHLWVNTSRTVNGETRRFIEYIDMDLYDSARMSVEDSHYMDAGKKNSETEVTMTSAEHPNSTITSITKADPCVVTIPTSTDFANGDKVTFTDIVGMTELNGRTFELANVGGSTTFELIDPETGANVISTNYNTYDGGGKVYNLSGPILVTSTSHSVNPQVSISTISQASPPVVTTLSDHGFENNDIVYIDSISETSGPLTQALNDDHHTITVLSDTTFSIDGADTTGDSYTSGGNVEREDVITFKQTTGMPELSEKYFRAYDRDTNTFKLNYVNTLPVENYYLNDTLYGGATTGGKYVVCKPKQRGLYHLEGETVEIIRDGRYSGTTTITNGVAYLGTENTASITGISSADPCVVTCDNTYKAGDIIRIDSVQGMTEINGLVARVKSATSTSITLERLDETADIDTSSGYTAYYGGGVVTGWDRDVFGADINVGLPTTWSLETLPFESGSNDGTPQSKKKRISQLKLRVRDTLGLKYGSDTNNMDEYVFSNMTQVNEVPELYTGDIAVKFPKGTTREAIVRLEGEGVYPCQIQAIMPKLNTQDES